jgi:hypothetical protein
LRTGHPPPVLSVSALIIAMGMIARPQGDDAAPVDVYHG